MDHEKGEIATLRKTRKWCVPFVVQNPAGSWKIQCAFSIYRYHPGLRPSLRRDSGGGLLPGDGAGGNTEPLNRVRALKNSASSFPFSVISDSNHARLYDGTIANDFYRAMTNIESRFDSGETSPAAVAPGHLLAMVDALQAGTLNPAQQETVQTLRAAIVALAE